MSEHEEQEELLFTVKLGDKVHNLDLNKDLAIDKHSINRELARQPALYAWYATLHEIAKDKTALCKHKLETFEASLEMQIRQMDNPPVKLTADTVSAMVKDNVERRRMVEEYMAAKKAEGLLQVGKASFDQRKDMLISVASNMRNELDDDLKILKEKAEKVTKKSH